MNLRPLQGIGRARRKPWRELMALAFSFGLLATAADAQVKVSLVSAESSIQPGRAFTVALRLEHQPHWHTYWQYAGTGYPTSLTWNLPKGWKAGEIQWPVPMLIKDAAGKVTGHGYDGEVLLLVTLTPPEETTRGRVITLPAKAEWLMCAESCIPGESSLQLNLPVAVRAAVPDAKAAEQIAAAVGRLPVTLPAGWTAKVSREARTIILTIEAATELKSPHFFSADGLIAYDEPQAAKATDATLALTLPLAADVDPGATHLKGVLAYTNPQGEYIGISLNLSLTADRPVGVPPATTGSASGAGLLATLGLAFVGGLILNLMPCVFPVLGIKILGFVNLSGNNRRLVTLHGLVFSAGVLLSFWSLAAVLAVLRASGDQLGWGFQLQSPAFVFALAAVMLVFALSLSGVFEFGLRATGVGASLQMKDGYAGSFFTGVLATVVATPCSAPFLAPALGAALALPTGQSFLVFTAIAVGLALPYLLLSAFPQAIRLLPKSGAWMETFKQLMAFPLYATVGYLLWVLAGQTPENGLLFAFFGLTLVAMAGWCYGRFAHPGEGWSRGRHGFIASMGLFALGLATGWPQEPVPTGVRWEAWSPEAVARANAAGRTVYVDFTARWCATCQANKQLVFGNDEVNRAFRAQGIVTLKADWTNRDPRITEELTKWHRSAVPFNLVIKPGQPPQALPELLAPGIVLEAINAP